MKCDDEEQGRLCRILGVVPEQRWRIRGVPEYKVELIALPVTAFRRDDDLIPIAPSEPGAFLFGASPLQMNRISSICEELHVFAGTAERTGVTIELRGIKTGQRTCTSLTDLVRKYKLYGDGNFYLPVGHWPKDETVITLDNVKWLGMGRAVDAEKVEERKRKRSTRAETES